jgi:hypothetical protein
LSISSLLVVAVVVVQLQVHKATVVAVLVGLEQGHLR